MKRGEYQIRRVLTADGKKQYQVYQRCGLRCWPRRWRYEAGAGEWTEMYLNHPTFEHAVDWIEDRLREEATEQAEKANSRVVRVDRIDNPEWRCGCAICGLPAESGRDRLLREVGE